MILPLTIRSSNTDTIFSCNGSLLAVPRVPARDDDGGLEGSLLHYLIAQRLVLELGATPPESGLVAPTLPKGYKLPAFSGWVVDWSVRWVRDNISTDWSLSVEVPVAYRYDLPRPVWVPVSEIVGPIPDDHEVKDGLVCIRYVIVSGHLDLLAQSPDGLSIHGGDWKTGPIGADPAESNWQAATYLGLAKRAWEETQAAKFSLCQPKIDEEETGIPRISTVEMTGEQLDAMNTALAEQICRALENRYETDSSPKACKWCPVAANRPWLCPSLRAEEDFMKAKLTPTILQELQAEPNDALLGDFVISGRTLKGPVESATEMLHERIAMRGYVDAGSGHRLTTTTRPGKYKLVNPEGAWGSVNRLIPDRVAQVVNYSKDRLVDEIAEAQGIPKSGKKDRTAEKVFKEEVACFMEQGETKLLVIT